MAQRCAMWLLNFGDNACRRFHNHLELQLGLHFHSSFYLPDHFHHRLNHGDTAR